MLNKKIQFFPDRIEINTQFLRQGLSLDHKELFHDIFANYYTDQNINILAVDGEDVTSIGLVEFFIDICKLYNIPFKKIKFISPATNIDDRFSSQLQKLNIFWTTLDSLNSSMPMEINTDAVFVGYTVGRFSPLRLRLMYELDQIFPNDAYLIHRFKPFQIENLYEGVLAYQPELDWIKNRVFQVDSHIDPIWDERNALHWSLSIKFYHSIFSKFYIEVVPETDPFSNWWFTEKTARCLCTGKPFVLLAGQHSLTNLKKMGFETYSTVIDESYDSAATPSLRTKAILKSLKELYDSPNRQSLIDQMYSIAQRNMVNFRKLDPKHKQTNDPTPI
jgi:hypothetical protein